MTIAFGNRYIPVGIEQGGGYRNPARRVCSLLVDIREPQFSLETKFRRLPNHRKKVKIAM
jgi:hypothetical protein